MTTSQLRNSATVTRAAALLGVDLGADEQALHNAYVQQIKVHPPDKEPQRFEQLRDAYQLLRDPLQRAQDGLFDVDPRAPLPALLDDQEQLHRHVGPEPWLQALRERPRK